MCSQLPALIETILIKLSNDSGGGFLKLCLSILTSVTHAQSSRLLKKFLESSVFIIGLELDVPELCVNVKRIWVNCGISHLKAYTVTTDLKLCNLLLGMMSHSSCHPCA